MIKQTNTYINYNLLRWPLFRGGEGGGTWVNFCWVCAAGLSDPLPANYRPQPGATFGQICNFRDPNLFIFYFNELTLFLD